MKENQTQEYRPSELMVAAASREIRDGEVVFLGVGLPCLGGLLAKVTHAPNSVLAIESGCIGFLPRRVILGIGDNAGMENATIATSLWRLFADQQRGYFDIGMVGGAQVDRYGNLNSTAIIGDRTYESPETRLPGSGGSNDIGSSARRTVITIPLDKRRFVERVDYITTPGHLRGGEDRKSLGLPGNGPAAIITDKCIFRFDPRTKEAYLDSVHPGVTVNEVRESVSWPLRISPSLSVTPPPTEEQVRLIRILDQDGIYTSKGLSELTFEQYMAMLESSYGSLSRLYQLKGLLG